MGEPRQASRGRRQLAAPLGGHDARLQGGEDVLRRALGPVAGTDLPDLSELAHRPGDREAVDLWMPGELAVMRSRRRPGIERQPGLSGRCPGPRRPTPERDPVQVRQQRLGRRLRGPAVERIPVALGTPGECHQVGPVPGGVQRIGPPIPGDRGAERLGRPFRVVAPGHEALLVEPSEQTHRLAALAFLGLRQTLDLLLEHPLCQVELSALDQRLGELATDVRVVGPGGHQGIRQPAHGIEAAVAAQAAEELLAHLERRRIAQRADQVVKRVLDLPAPAGCRGQDLVNQRTEGVGGLVRGHLRLSLPFSRCRRWRGPPRRHRHRTDPPGGSRAET